MEATSRLCTPQSEPGHAAGVSLAERTIGLKAEARRLGFELAGVAPAVTPSGIHEFLDWLDRGFAGEMHYLPRRAAAYEHPRHVLGGVRSVVMLGLNYNTDAHAASDDLAAATNRESTAHRGADRPSSPADPVAALPGKVFGAKRLVSRPPLPPLAKGASARGRVARYAQGASDYHDLIRTRLESLREFVERQFPGCLTRGVVDTAPLLERDFARLAGLGWFGKNTMLINKYMGSWFFLAALLVDRELVYDAPHETAHCGTCTRCLDACPTGAFVEPWVLDARRCISYLTIEHRGPFQPGLREGVGEWLFGCDICQEVCPWNRKAPTSGEPAFQPNADLAAIDAGELLLLSAEEFRARLADTPLMRPRRAGVLRNAAIVLGNSGDPRAAGALAQALDDVEPLVRGAAAWGLGRLKSPIAPEVLRRRLAVEDDSEVRDEIVSALSNFESLQAAPCPR